MSVDIVTADGRYLTASESENADLFWAVRGGGGNFGVVTSFEYKLKPVGPMVTLCAPFYPMADGAEVMRRWREHTADAPEDYASNFLFWSIPAHPEFPRGAARHAGRDPGRRAQRRPGGRRSLYPAPARAGRGRCWTLSGPVPYVGVQAAFDPLFLKGERQNYWKSIYLDRLDDAAIDMIVARANDRPDPWALIAVWLLGGAMAQVDPMATAIGERGAPYLLSYDTGWPDPADNERGIAWTREAWAEAKPFSSGGAYLNFPGQGEEGEALLRASYGLGQLRPPGRDQDQVRSGQPVPPQPKHQTGRLGGVILHDSYPRPMLGPRKSTRKPRGWSWFN